MIKPVRNYGIDSLRILLMLGIISLHIMGHGGVLSAANAPAVKGTAWLIEVVAYPSVNGFVLISGFVGYHAKQYYPRIKNILSLYFTVLFYSVVITAVSWVVRPDVVTIKDIITSFFPLLTKKYWFFTAYYAMFLVSPILNFLVDKAENKLIVIGCAAFLLFSIFEIVSGAFSLNNGYSFIWFSYLYTIGALTRKYDVASKISTRLLLLLAICATLVSWLPKAVCEMFNIHFWGSDRLSGLLISYCSPTIVCVALCCLCVFVKIKPTKIIKQVISWIFPSVFAVYLIHDNYYTRNLLILDRFKYLGEGDVFSMIFCLVATVFAIFAVSILIDKVRNIVFRFLKVDELSEKVDMSITSIINKVSLRLE